MQDRSTEMASSTADAALRIELEDGRSATVPVPQPGPPPAGGFVFGMYKAGSTMLHSALDNLCNGTGTPTFSIVTETRRVAGIAIEREKLTPDSKQELNEVFSREGIIFSGFREFPTFLDLDLTGRPTVLLVRDPRDMLTSQYFSLKFSHTTGRGNEAVAAARSQLAEVEIDDFVLRNSKNGLRWFSSYERGLVGSNLMLRRYEDIIFDKLRFFGEVCRHLSLDVREQRLARVAEKFDVRPAQEDPYKHVRQVTPGDHRAKLKPETIEQLNDIFSAVIRRYDYDKAS